MQFRGSARVYTADDRKVGRIVRVVLNPITKQITHIVVRVGVIITVDKLIPLSMFRSATCDRVTLCGSVGNLKTLPDYSEAGIPEQELVSVPVDLGGELYVYQLTTTPVDGASRYDKGSIPKDTIALKEGALVLDDDGGTIGNVESLVANPRTGCVTHAVISQNTELKGRKPVPMSWLKIIGADEVHLSVNPAAFERLPLY